MKAANIGFDIMRDGLPAIDAVEAAVASLEDDPLFNAGTGSSPNLLGEIEDDAAIMDGSTLRGAGVAMLKSMKNPVKVARLVMDHTDHVLLAGKIARKIALAHHAATANLKVPSRIKLWRRQLRSLKNGRPTGFSTNHRSTIRSILSGLSDTVGALAVDDAGAMAAADSTGGLLLKLPGRIGDSAILGAGIYADDNSAAAATGIGEQAMKLVVSKATCTLMRGTSPTSAARTVVKSAYDRFGPGMGIITLNRNGNYGVAHNTRNLCWALVTPRKSEHGITGERVR